MRILFLLLLLANSIYIMAQCKPFVSEDKFTKNKQVFYGGTLEESLMFSDRNMVIYFHVGTVNDTLCSVVTVSKILDADKESEIDDLREDFKIEKGQKVYLALSNGESVQLTALGNSTRSKKKLLSSVTVSAAATLSLTKEQLKLLATNGITDYRVELSGVAPLQNKVKSKKADKLKEQFKCGDAELVIKQ